MRIAVRSFSAPAGLLLALTAAVTVLAADGVPTVDVSGVVLDTEGQAAEVDSARVEELETPRQRTDRDPDRRRSRRDLHGGATGVGHARRAGARTLRDLRPRGEPVVINEEGCTETTTPFGTLEVPIPGAVPTEPLEIVLDQTVIDGLCPAVTATPEAEAPAPTGSVRNASADRHRRRGPRDAPIDRRLCGPPGPGRDDGPRVGGAGAPPRDGWAQPSDSFINPKAAPSGSLTIDIRPPGKSNGATI